MAILLKLELEGRPMGEADGRRVSDPAETVDDEGVAAVDVAGVSGVCAAPCVLSASSATQ